MKQVIIQTFFSYLDAIKYLISIGKCNVKKPEQATSKISNCCKHKAISAYGYKWEFLPEPL